MSGEIIGLIKDIAEISAGVVGAIGLVFYTQRDRKSFLRLNCNSNKLQFSVDLENVGPNLARIKKIEMRKRNCAASTPQDAQTLIDLFGAKDYVPISEGISITPVDTDLNYKAISRMFSNLTGDVIGGSGTKHHLFRCQVEDVASLKYLWDTLKDYEITVTYTDVYGMFFWKRRTCTSHFDRDYASFVAALGNRTAFGKESDAAKQIQSTEPKLLDSATATNLETCMVHEKEKVLLPIRDHEILNNKEY